LKLLFGAFGKLVRISRFENSLPGVLADLVDRPDRVVAHDLLRRAAGAGDSGERSLVGPEFLATGRVAVVVDDVKVLGRGAVVVVVARAARERESGD